jgi:hypothetical protein
MKTFSNLRFNIIEKTLTPAELKKREKIAKAIERDNPSMPKDRKMAIATATAKKVAEEQGVAEGSLNELSKDKLKAYSRARGATIHHDLYDADTARETATDKKKYGDEKAAADWEDEASWLNRRAEKGAKGVATATIKLAKKVAEEKEGMAKGSRDKVHLKTPKHGLADHPGRNTGVGLRTFTATPEQNRCSKCNSLFKNHYQKEGMAEDSSAQDKNIAVGEYVRTAAGVEGVVKKITPDGKKLTVWNRRRQADHRVDISKAERILGIARRKMAEQGMAEAKADPTGSWVVYNGSKLKKFKTREGAKAYGEKNGGTVASSEYYHDKGQQERTKRLMQFTKARGGLTGPKGPLPEEVELEEGAMSELHGDIADMMDKHIAKYNKMGGSEALMAKVDPAAKKLAAMHGIEHAAARKHVNAYIDTQIKEEAVDEAGLADLYPAQVITHIIAKSDVDRHSALLKKESGIKTKTVSLPRDHSKYKTHVGIVSKGEKEGAAHDSGYANPISPYKMKGLSEQGQGVEEGLVKAIKRLATGKDVKSRAGQEIAKSQDASMTGDTKTSKKHFDRYDKLDKLANKEQARKETGN